MMLVMAGEMHLMMMVSVSIIPPPEEVWRLRIFFCLSPFAYFDYCTVVAAAAYIISEVYRWACVLPDTSNGMVYRCAVAIKSDVEFLMGAFVSS